MSILKSLFGRRNPAFTAPLQPDQPFFAVGDVHGCFDHITRVPELMEHHGAPDAPVLFVGDYVDRGPDSAGVLRWLFERNRAEPDRVICLMGNHERMMLDAIKNPEKHGPFWLRHGGLETLASFGVAPVMGQVSRAQWSDMGEALRQAMGPELLDWIANLPLSWQSGNVFACHAGAHPMQPVMFQNPKTLLWGCEEFTNRVRDDGIWILHGHTIVDQAYAHNGRIAIDTGAYATSNLTCAYIAEDGVSFLTA